MKRFNTWDFVIILVAVLVCTMFYVNIKTRATGKSDTIVRIEGKAGNLEKEIAHSIDVGDVILDKNGTPFFRIESVLVRPSRQAIPNWNNEVIAVDSPELETVEFTAVSVNPSITPNNIFYNWQLMNPGMNVYIETNKTGFFAILIRIEETSKSTIDKHENELEET